MVKSGIMVSKPRLIPTFKQSQFAKKYVENKGNGTQTALQVYDGNYESAKSISRKNLKKPVVQEEIKKILNKKGLTLDKLVTWSDKVVENNLNGKPSQAVASDMIKFLFKVHNVLPASKSMSMSYSKIEKLPVEDYKKIQELLTKLNDNTTKILQDLHK